VLVRDRLGQVACLAGDWDEAERLFRSACDELARMGEQTYLSTEAANLGRALVELERFDDTDDATRVSEAAAASDDVVSQVTWRSVRARVLSVSGAHERAVRLAGEAVALAADRDVLDVHGDARLQLAIVLRAAGRAEEAHAAADEALRLYEQKGDVLSAERTRAVLGLARAEAT
jgi:tetratricopeptide (TPR) repeat protein